MSIFDLVNQVNILRINNQKDSKITIHLVLNLFNTFGLIEHKDHVSQEHFT